VIPSNQMEQKFEAYDYMCKILFVGEAYGGKSTLVSKITGEEPQSNKYIPTIGMDFKSVTKEFDGKKIRYQLWDRAGIKRFQTITTGYYRGTHMIILVLDLTNKQSFDLLENRLYEINTHATDNAMVFILGTKSDLISERKISYQKIRDFSLGHNIEYIELVSQQYLTNYKPHRTRISHAVDINIDRAEFRI
jgi:Ras-related protein Rab-1A